ncbi:hypothetical protein HGRIS_003578 [Hohenbuehelia grisea]|uniref:Peptidase A1 domain-containing protein n=1 Tax=Hohenbuehelia grisea TaxID=104357 RepID=A0ABR3JFV8_9AGAR
MKAQSVFKTILSVACLSGLTVALPYPPGVGIVSLPLKPVARARSLPAHIAHQQHVNHAKRRLATLTGREGPSDDELRANLYKRMALLDEPQLTKRFNRHGATRPKPVSGATANSFASSKDDEDDESSSSSSTGFGNITPIELEALSRGGVAAAEEPQDRNSLGLDIIANDVGYFSTIQIGTPPRDFRILMDSGSADLWVGSEECVSTNGGTCGNHVFLGRESSSTHLESGRPFSITYGTGAVSGTVVKDNIRFAGFELTNHTFGVARNETEEFSDNSTVFDGLMGLAQSRLSNQRTLTPVEALAQTGQIREAIISYKISRLADEKNDGTITFGGLDASKFSANTLVTVPNLSRIGFWEAAMDKITLDGQELDFAGRTAILDTGTTLIIAPPADARSLHQAIPGARQFDQDSFTVPCNTTAKIGLTFGGREFTIDPRDLVFAPLNSASGDCLSGISAGTIGGDNQWLVGDTFLKSAYFSTNVNKNEMSLAALT